jgi:acetyltransferase-like isoleucine patch superfamily enzyme
MYKKFTFLQYLRNKIRIDKNLYVEIAKSAKIVHCDISIKGKNNQLIIGENVSIRYTQIEILGNDCTITIGKDTTIGHNSYLSAKDAATLHIGEDCMFSRNVKIMTADGHPIYAQNKQINPAKSIMINAHVWLADNVTILKGITLGEGSIVGINATVTKDTSSYSVVAGNPAILIKENIIWNR